MANLEGLVDLSKMHWRNKPLVVKKAIEWVENNRSLGKNPLGLSWERLPDKRPSKVNITINSGGREKTVYEPPESWDSQLTLACWLYAIRGYVPLDKRAHIFCTNSRGRGNYENSISTKHCKSKLQEEYNDILSNQDLLDDYKNEVMSQRDLPEGLTPVQRELAQRSVNGEVPRSVVVSITKSHDIDDLDLFNEWKTMRLIPDLRESSIPINIDFQSYSIQEVVKMLESEGLAPSLRQEIDALEQENIELAQELDRMSNRSLWERIINRRN